MKWTDVEWDGFCALLEEGWPGAFDDEARASWRVLLDSTPPPAAVLALRRLLLQGRRFRPSVSELLSETRADPSQPTFDEAYRLIFGPGGLTHAYSFGIPPRTVHPLVSSFAVRQGIERLCSLPVSDPTWGERTRRDLEGAWNRHVDAYDGREIHAIASGSSGGLKRLDPLSAVTPAARLETGK